MIIDSKQYDGLCACGKSHKMETQFCVIESGSLKNISAYMKQNGIQGYSVAVYDENTYKATEDRHPQVDAQVILSADNLHANEHGVELLLEKLPEETEIIIAIGSGTIHDISRYCAYKRNIDFVSCPTAASVDGFCSSVAAMTWNGCKKTLTAVAPKIVVADLDIIKSAPIRLAKSGFGDMIGKYISLTDWKIGNLLTGELYCDTIADITRQATENVLGSAEGIVSGDSETYENLMYGLLMSGLAMQMMGNSRPASGAEHHISHMIEMEPIGLDVHSNALHGEKVGVGTLLAIEEYYNLAAYNGEFRDYSEFDEHTIAEIFGKVKAAEILSENQNDAANTITADLMALHWHEICEEIKKLPDINDLKKLYLTVHIHSKLSDIAVDDSKAKDLLKYSPMVRNRLTLMRLRKCLAKD